jgi:deoxyribodipyrimidine photo-lyase
MKSSVPPIRILKVNDRAVHEGGDYVLYWMNAFRRIEWNFSFQRAVDWCLELKRPLLILEALRCDYQWASDRLHQFILEGMAENARRLKRSQVFYYPYIEPKEGAGKGLLEALWKRACVVIADEFPAFFLPRALSAAAVRVRVAMEKVDSNGILPMRAADRIYSTAYAFRRFLQKVLPGHIIDAPKAHPLRGVRLPRHCFLAQEIRKRWPPASPETLKGGAKVLSRLSLEHGVAPVELRGGSDAARRTLMIFIEDRLADYAEKRNHPEVEATSGLSPYLHFGHISVHQIFHELMEAEDWFLDRLSEKATGSKAGWWGMSESAEAFLDELITWRELGFNMCWQREGYDEYESLPKWALGTLETHIMDKREHLYTLEEFEEGRTHDPLWNAVQMQLVKEGRIHSYLRMLWGKKILQWTPKPREALEVMIELNNKYALDGRDPNSYSGIFWVLGRYDRPWGPERPIFGKVRYMSSKNTARKVKVKNYIQRYTP